MWIDDDDSMHIITLNDFKELKISNIEKNVKRMLCALCR